MLRAVRLLQSVEAGKTLGTAALQSAASLPGLSFEEYLTDKGREADLTVLLGMREQVRRMANSSTTMTAIVNSSVARDATFAAANSDSKVAATYMARSGPAMTTISQSAATLEVIIDNPTSWYEYHSSPIYDGAEIDHDVALNTILLLSGLSVGQEDFHGANGMKNLIESPSGSSEIAESTHGLRAAVQSDVALGFMAENGQMLGYIFADNSQTLILLNSYKSMYIMVRSESALAAITLVPSAKALLATIPLAIQTAMASPTWISIVTGSTTLVSNMRNVLVNGLNLSTSLATTSNVLGNTPAVLVIAASTPAMQAILAMSDTTTKMANSSKFNKFLEDELASEMIAASSDALGIISNLPDAWEIYQAGPFFADNLAATIASLTDIDIETFASVTSMINNATQLALIAGNEAATQALLSNTAAVNYLAAHDNLGVMLDNQVSMDEIKVDIPLMTQLITTQHSFDIMMDSARTITKAAIFANPALITIMLADEYAFGLLSGTSVTEDGPTPDTVIGSFQTLALTGNPTNIILLTAKIGSITAARIDNYFRTSPDATAVPPRAAGPTTTASCPGTHAASVYPVINKAFTAIQWDINSIAATAAARITVTYVPFD